MPFYLNVKSSFFFINNLARFYAAYFQEQGEGSIYEEKYMKEIIINKCNNCPPSLFRNISKTLAKYY